MSLSSSLSSTSASSNGQMIRPDIESFDREVDSKQSKAFIRFRRVPIPVRKGHVLSDVFKHVSCLVILL